MKPTHRTALLAILAALLVAGIVALAWPWLAPTREAGVGTATGSAAPNAAGPVDIGGPFTLVTKGGEPFTEADLTGKPYAIFFGFTYCPDVCPTTLNEMTAWIDALGEKADAMRFVFVTVDPARDDPETLTRYVEAFNDRVIPLTGDEAAIRDMLDAYKIYAAKVPLEGGDYTMNHTAAVYLMDGEGGFVDVISFKDDQATALAKLRGLVE